MEKTMCIENEKKRAKRTKTTPKDNGEGLSKDVIIAIFAVIIVILIGLGFYLIDREKNTLHFQIDKVIKLNESFSGNIFSGVWVIEFSPENNFHGDEKISDSKEEGIICTNGYFFSGKTNDYSWTGTIRAIPLEKGQSVYFVEGKKFGLDHNLYFRP